MNRKSTARPKIEINITGRRPKRSESWPRIGPQRNCIPPHVAAKIALQVAACAVAWAGSPCMNDLIRLGSTGIMMPNDSEFMIDVAKMNPKAARLPVEDGWLIIPPFAHPLWAV